MEKLTTKELAKHFNLTDMTIYNGWLKKGCPFEKVIVGLREEYRFDLEKVEKWRKEMMRWQNQKNITG